MTDRQWITLTATQRVQAYDVIFDLVLDTPPYHIRSWETRDRPTVADQLARYAKPDSHAIRRALRLLKPGEHPRGPAHQLGPDYVWNASAILEPLTTTLSPNTTLQVYRVIPDQSALHCVVHMLDCVGHIQQGKLRIEREDRSDLVFDAHDCQQLADAFTKLAAGVAEW